MTPLLTLLLVGFGLADTSYIRVNQVGYLPDAPKVAVVCSLSPVVIHSFVVRDSRGRTVLGPQRAEEAGSFGPCAMTHRLDFSKLRATGSYTIVAGAATSPAVRIGPDVYAGGADTALYYMRQQRSGWNPLFKDSVHKYDGFVVDDTGKVVKRVAVSGGWADASDYLQYVTTSANATYLLLAAQRDHPRAFADAFDARGLPGGNGMPDALDEARHGLDWLARMFPNEREMYNQIADDRDHAFPDLMVDDSSEYGWGKGKERPVYPCTGRPQGLFRGKNRATGLASTAGKYASAFAFGAIMMKDVDPVLAARLREKAEMAYRVGRSSPGACQTAPGVSPYFYEEDNWADDMELGAAAMYALTRDSAFLSQAVGYAMIEPVTPWMGADTANHYQWFPWHNNGHWEIWRAGGRAEKEVAARNYRVGLERVARRANNGFRVGIPFIWCSNNLMTSFATQALLYRRMTGDNRFREYEQAAIDWLFGANPWGTSMMIGYPNGGVWAKDPHSNHAHRMGAEVLRGGLLDGPVYRSIFSNLRGISLHQPDEYAPFNTGFIVYHDDYGDYSTNEPIMDGTANIAYLLAALAPDRRTSGK